MQFPKHFPELQTSRLLLRALTVADRDAIFALRSNEEVNRFVGRDAAQTPADAARFINDRIQDIIENKGMYWAIESRATGKLIGTICYWNLNDNDNTAEIGYELLPDMQGQGIMQEAIVPVIAWGFNDMRLEVITAFPLEVHGRSVKLLEKNDFSYDEIIDGHLFYKLSRQIWQLHQPT
jgi:ribosomal-protein-alanine N-acetyltransferase